jgi:hypothetical protein
MKRLRYLMVLILAALILCTIGSALFESNSLQSYIDKYNARMETAPGLMKSLIGNERVQFNIALNNGSPYKVGMNFETGIITRTVPAFENPSIIIETSEGTISQIIGSKDPISAGQAAIQSGNLTVTGQGIMERIKVSAALSSMDLLRLLLGVLRG